MQFFRQVRGFIRRRLRQPVYPKIVKVSEFTDTPVKFRVHSDTEAFRTEGFGGEQEQIELFIAELKSDDVVYDIGASIGLISLISASICQQGQVIAFEPDPEINQRLSQNIRLNQVQNIVVKPYVINDKNGKVDLFTAGNDNVSPSLTGSNVKMLELDTVPVEGFTLDYLIENENLPLPDVLKIDVEGAEYNVIQGAGRLLSGELGQRPRFIFLEAHPEFLVDYDVSCQDVLDKIVSHGYIIIREHKREAQLHYLLKLEN